MHEFSVARSICRIALEEGRRAGAQRVTVIRLEIGVMRQVVPQLLFAAFQAVSRDTLLENARLELVKMPVTIECKHCTHVTHDDQLVFTCQACGSRDVRVSGGDELRIGSICVSLEKDHEYHSAS